MLKKNYDKGLLKDKKKTKKNYKYILDVYKLVCSDFYCMWCAYLKCTLVIYVHSYDFIILLT